MICTDGKWFKDEDGRTLILRGANLGGSTKVPFCPDGATHLQETLFEHRDVSFVGRPFPLEEADEHFARLKAWGLTFLRFLITWEAIEHVGPGIYDEEYLNYVCEVVEKAAEYGIDLFIDPHQDVWSRFSGGDGAPGWTLAAAGLDITKFDQTGAALVHAVHGDPFPQMIWPANYGKLAAATMFTLFFGGNDFAPHTRVDGEPVQEFLQRHYIAAVKQVATRLRGMPNVVGYDTMNEPHSGFIGCQDLEAPMGILLKGDAPTPLQAMLLGAGYAQDVAQWKVGYTGFRRAGSRVVNSNGHRAWLEGYDCVWRQNGVWEADAAGEPRLVHPDHFAQVGGRPVEFHRDYVRPFANRFAREIRSADPGAIIFVEGLPVGDGMQWGPDDESNIVHAAHWYDGITLYAKDYIPWLGANLETKKPIFGRRRTRRALAQQVANIKRVSEAEMGNVPTLIGEFGIPFDMREGEAYRTGDFSRQVRALDTSFRVMEENLASCTLWNYTADNSNARGDQWNGEDLSVFSRDQQSDPDDINSGGRALRAAVRPYAKATAGEPLNMAFDVNQTVFEYVFRHDQAVQAPTEIFVPSLQYPRGCTVEVSDGTYEIDREAQLLTYRHSDDQAVHTIRLSPSG